MDGFVASTGAGGGGVFPSNSRTFSSTVAVSSDRGGFTAEPNIRVNSPPCCGEDGGELSFSASYMLVNTPGSRRITGVPGSGMEAQVADPVWVVAVRVWAAWPPENGAPGTVS